jgi:hypothetical protein
MATKRTAVPNVVIPNPLIPKKAARDAILSVEATESLDELLGHLIGPDTEPFA